MDVLVYAAIPHDYVILWKHFAHYWPFVIEFPRSQAFVPLSLIARIFCWSWCRGLSRPPVACVGFLPGIILCKCWIWCHRIHDVKRNTWTYFSRLIAHSQNQCLNLAPARRPEAGHFTVGPAKMCRPCWPAVFYLPCWAEWHGEWLTADTGYWRNKIWFKRHIFWLRMDIWLQIYHPFWNS